MRRLALDRVLFFSFMVAAMRWWLLGAAGSTVMIVFSQLLHAITYGAFHIASVLYIDRLAPATAKTTGQALNNAASYGIGMLAGFLLSGFLYERIGSSKLFMLSGGMALAAGIIFKTLRGTPEGGFED